MQALQGPARTITYDPPPHAPEPIRSAQRAAAMARSAPAPAPATAPERAEVVAADRPVGHHVDVRA